MKCRYCGCTDAKACAGGCSWVAPRVCSRCARRELMVLGHGDGQGVDVPYDLLRLLVTAVAGCFVAFEHGDEMDPREVGAIRRDVMLASQAYDNCAARRLVPMPSELVPQAMEVADPSQPPRLWRPGDPNPFTE